MHLKNIDSETKYTDILKEIFITLIKVLSVYNKCGHEFDFQIVNTVQA